MSRARIESIRRSCRWTRVAELEDNMDKQKTSEAKPARKRAECSECGSEFAPGKLLENIKKKSGLPDEVLGRCPACRRRIAAEKLAHGKAAVAGK